ncbi:serine hydrolase domain-containing protein [Parasphingorhabdus sp.]|uniref:serine hydrolase domain-containing protein n=1 Tax=Parasphingorhabdus sp. TaxID=2709688 RepID=UPI0032662CF0
MTTVRTVIGILGLYFLSQSAQAEKSAPAPVSAKHAERIELIEAGLRPTYGVRDGEKEQWTLAERMRHYDVPGVSIAVAIDGKLVWAKAYGVLDKNSGKEVDSDTLFQAASLSKPIASLAGLALVQDGLLSLDKPANEFLTSWQIPDNEFTKQEPVTIRHLMSHRGGTTIHGFKGYETGADLPSLPQILDGVAPANTLPVIVNQLPGKEYRYSGGGFTILQLAIEDAIGRSFADVVEGRIFYPADMTRSNFRYPVNDPNAATGHDGKGSLSMAGRDLVYPELAAAGMWTTPSELVTLGSLVADARNTGNLILDTALARQLVPNDAEMPGLGFGLNDAGDGLTFVHNGHNPGFSARWINYADGRASVAVLTNSDSGGNLIREIFSGIGHVYGWKQDAYEVRDTIPLSEAELRDIAGSYAFGQDDKQPVATISVIDGELWIDGILVERSRLHALSKSAYFVTKGLNFETERSASGQVIAISVEGEIRLVRLLSKD